MKALTLWPEWAWAICHAGKRVENRGWHPRGQLPGDTLCCACSRAEAAGGHCHRVWAAHALVRHGWRVILDGAEVAP